MQDQASLIAKLTSKVETSEEKTSLLTEQVNKLEQDLKNEEERFSAKLSETQKYFEEMLQERETESAQLKEMIHSREEEIAAKDSDLRELITRHERDVQRLMAKGEVNMEDHVLEMMEQRIKDTNEVLDGKLKVIEVLQQEMKVKDKQIDEQNTLVKSLKERLQLTTEQNTHVQQSFAESEFQWKQEREKLQSNLKDLAEKHETEKGEKELQIVTMQTSLSQYEAAYTQAASQYNSLQQRFEQLCVEMEKLKSGETTVISATPDHSMKSQQTEHLKQQIADLQQELAQKDSEISQIKTSFFKQSSSEHSDEVERLKGQLADKDAQLKELLEKKPEAAASNKDTKFIKMKAQMTSKVKSLEKQLEELRKVRSFFSFFSCSFRNFPLHLIVQQRCLLGS